MVEIPGGNLQEDLDSGILLTRSGIPHQMQVKNHDWSSSVLWNWTVISPPPPPLLQQLDS